MNLAAKTKKIVLVTVLNNLVRGCIYLCIAEVLHNLQCVEFSLGFSEYTRQNRVRMALQVTDSNSYVSHLSRKKITLQKEI